MPNPSLDRMTTPKSDDVIVLGRDDVGVIAQSSGMRYYLTECCGASAKGLENYIGCRGCYAEIDYELGGLPLQSGPVPQPFGDGLPYEAWFARRASL